MRSLLLILSILLFIPAAVCQAQTLKDAKKAYAQKNNKKTEKIIKKIIKEEPKGLDTRLFAVNYCYWEGKTNCYRSMARRGYDLSADGSEYEYFFYNKITKNRIMIEGYYTDGTLYNKNGYVFEYAHNYRKKDWFSINYQYEDRHFNPNQRSDLLGLGFVTFLDEINKNLVLNTNIQASIQRGFFPNYSLDNELFYYQGNNTYSLDLRLSVYENDTLVTFLSPHYRRDWNRFYLGIRPYLVMSKSDNVLYWKGYGGYFFNYKHSVEAAVSVGTNKEDGLNIDDFVSYDLKYKYNFTKSTEISVKFNHYDNFSNRTENTMFLNVLWKY